MRTVKMVKIEVACSLSDFRKFLIKSTCQSFIPMELLKDENVFPERLEKHGLMYVEAVDKERLQKIEDIQFVRAVDVVGAIYSSKSGSTKLTWRRVKNKMGKVTGEASINTLINLFFKALRIDPSEIHKYIKGEEEV